MEEAIQLFMSLSTDQAEEIGMARQKLQEEVRAKEQELIAREKQLEQDRKSLEAEKRKMAELHEVESDTLTIVVGGTAFTTTRSTLCKKPDTMLASAFSGDLKIHRLWI